jgi:TolB-like protein/Tfp pilus assembly protein PilF
MRLFAELSRRKVFKVGAAYLVVAWLAVQAASIGFPAFDAPPWVLRVFILVALLGFPIAAVLAWMFETTPEGVKLDASKGGSRRVLAICAALAVLAIGWYFQGQPSFRKGDVATPTAAPEKSIAVLPFVNMSGDARNEYFSDGMSEELLNALAQVRDLKVAGRTSSFYYKGRNEDLRTIGKALGVANILEGSVRKQGNQVRITAQLIRVADDTHLWSHAYDGNLSDVFQLQENIARAITDQLKVALVGDQKALLVPVATTSPEAYSLYLQASAIFDRRDGSHYQDAIAALQEAIRLDPKYARAYSRLAAIYVVLPSLSDANLQDTQRLLMQDAQRASALDPTLAEPWASIGFSLGKFPGRLVEQRQAFEHALELDPDDATTNFWFGLSLVKTGYRKRGTALIERALAKDPMLPNALRWRGILYLHAGDIDRAGELLKRARDLGLSFADRDLADVASARGDNAAAIRLSANGSDAMFPGMSPDSREAIAEGLYGDAVARVRAVAVIEAYLATPHEHIPGMLPVDLAKLDAPARALAVEHRALTGDNSDFLALLWSRQGRALRALAEFPAFLSDFGFVALWDKYGAPDDCSKGAAGDYACTQ